MTRQPSLDSGEQQAILTFTIEDQWFAFQIQDMIEVVAMVELTPIQKKSPAYLGVANRHGNPMMVFDLRYVLNQQQKSIDVTSLILVTQLKDEFFGWVVDAVHQVEYFPVGAFQRLSTIEDNAIDQIVTEKTRVIQVVDNNLLLQQCRMQAREMA